MRLFVAIGFSKVVLDQLIEVQPQAGKGVRLSKPENLHLTLCFIGEAEIETVDKVLSTVFAEEFSLTLEGFGFFSHGKNNKTFWLGVQKNLALMDLQKKILTALNEKGFCNKMEKFSPHVTLARSKADNDSDFCKKFLHQPKLSIPVEVNHFALYSSRTLPEGPVYTVEKVYSLI